MHPSGDDDDFNTDIPGAGDDEHSFARPGNDPPGARRQATPQVEPEVEEHVECLIAGPVETGKTRYLEVLPRACSALIPNQPDMLFSYTDSMAQLIDQGTGKHRQRKGLDATTTPQYLDFSIEVNLHSEKRNGPPQRLGTRTFRCMDGPGGALFYANPAEPDLDRKMTEFRKELLQCGKSAASLVFFVDPISEPRFAMVTGNLAQLFGSLAVRTQMPPRDPHKGWLEILPFRKPPANRPLPPPEYGLKLRAQRVLFIFNRIDQLCAHWQDSWQRTGDPKGRYTAYQIAQRFVKPVDLALQVLGTSFLQQVRGFLKPDAILAAGVCSAGGFIRGTGDPYLDRQGKPNLMASLPPEVLESKLALYGVRETILFAGFGTFTPNIVEQITRDRLRDESTRFV